MAETQVLSDTPLAVGHGVIMARVAAIGPSLAADAAACDEARRVIPSSMTMMVEAGLFRIPAPARVGGYELPIRTFHNAVTVISEACPSSGWVLMVMDAHHHVLGSFPAEAQDEVFGNGGGLVAGTLSWQGVATPSKGGYRINGRWQFGSGVDNADWVMLGCADANGAPLVHVVMPVAEIEVDDTWHVFGLQGSGSKDLVATDVFVPEHRTVNTLALFQGRSPHAAQHATNLYRISPQEMLSLSGTAAVLGSAKHALEAFVGHTRGRRNILTGARKAEHVPTQIRAAEAAIEIHAAELLVVEMHDEFDRIVETGERTDSVHRLKYCWQAAYGADLCRRAVNRLFEASGAHAVYDGGAVQTAFRNVNVATQHASIGFDTGAEAYGRVLLGAGAEGRG